MKVYREKRGPSDSLLSVDPGVNTFGVCYLGGVSFRLAEMEASIPVLKLAIPELNMALEKLAKERVDQLERMFPSNWGLALEYTFSAGQFSLGLNTFTVYFKMEVLRRRPDTTIVYVPCNMAPFLLKVKKPTWGQIKTFAKNRIDSLGSQVKVESKFGPHMTDAFLTTLFLRRSMFPTLGIREPSVLEVQDLI